MHELAATAEMPVGRQMEVAQRLLEICRDRRPEEDVVVRAGDVAALVHGLAALAGGKPLARDPVWPAIAALLREHREGMRLCQIASATQLPKQQVLHRLKRHGCSKVPGTYRWRLPERRELQAAEPQTQSGE